MTVRLQIILLARKFQPSCGRIARRIHIVPVLPIVDPRQFLHHMVLIIVTVPRDCPPGIPRNDLRVIFIQIINIHIAVHTFDRTGVGRLPHRSLRICIFLLVFCHPHIIRNLRHIDLIGNPVFICIDHRIIAGILNALTERIDHIADLRRCQGSQRIGILGIKDNRERNRIILDEIQDKIRLLLRHLDRSRIRINVRAQPQPCLARVCRIHGKKRIHIAAEPGCQHRKLYIIRCHLAPIYILLPVRHIHAARDRTDPLILRHTVHAKPRCDRAHTSIGN